MLNEPEKSAKGIINALIDRSNEIDVNGAELHYCGEGMQGGIDWEMSLQWHRTKGISYSQKCAFETVAAAATICVTVAKALSTESLLVTV